MGLIPKIDGHTPICESCGVCLCWNISDIEANEDRDFWEQWRCEDCNGGKRMSLKEWKSMNQLDTTKAKE